MPTHERDETAARRWREGDVVMTWDGPFPDVEPGNMPTVWRLRCRCLPCAGWMAEPIFPSRWDKLVWVDPGGVHDPNAMLVPGDTVAAFEWFGAWWAMTRWDPIPTA